MSAEIAISGKYGCTFAEVQQDMVYRSKKWEMQLYKRLGVRPYQKIVMGLFGASNDSSPTQFGIGNSVFGSLETRLKTFVCHTAVRETNSTVGTVAFTSFAITSFIAGSYAVGALVAAGGVLQAYELMRTRYNRARAFNVLERKDLL